MSQRKSFTSFTSLSSSFHTVDAVMMMYYLVKSCGRDCRFFTGQAGLVLEHRWSSLSTVILACMFILLHNSILSYYVPLVLSLILLVNFSHAINKYMWYSRASENIIHAAMQYHFCKAGIPWLKMHELGNPPGDLIFKQLFLLLFLKFSIFFEIFKKKF